MPVSVSFEQKVGVLQRRLSFFVVLCTCTILSFLLVQSVFLTTQDNSVLDSSTKRGFYTADVPWLHVLVFAGICLVLWLSVSLHFAPRLRRMMGRGVIGCAYLCSALMLGFLAWLVASCRIQPVMDAFNVYDAACGLTTGDLTSFAHGQYMDLYPNQRGLLLYDLLAVQLFGAQNAQYILQMLNVLWFAVSAFCLARAAGLLLGNCHWQRFLPVYLLFLPMGLYVTFLYGTMPGLACSSAQILCLSLYLQTPRRRYCVAAGLLGAAAALFKQNYLIVSIAVFLYFGWEALRKKKLRPLLMAVSFLISWVVLGQVVIALAYTPYGLTLSTGKPTSAWVALGVCAGDGNEGWFSATQAEQVKKIYTQQDTAAADAFCRDAIRDRLVYFGKNPSQALQFFSRKITSAWNVPTFQSLQINYNRTLSPDAFPLFIQLLRLQSGLNNLYCFGSNLVLTQIWVWCLAYFLLCRRNHTHEHLLFCLIFLGGFVFHLVWETKAQYALIYVFFMLPYAAKGLLLFRGELAGLAAGKTMPISALFPRVLAPLAVIAVLAGCGLSGNYLSINRAQAQAETLRWQQWLAEQTPIFPGGCYRILTPEGKHLLVDTLGEGSHAILSDADFGFILSPLGGRLLMDDVLQSRCYAIYPAASDETALLGMNSFGDRFFAGLKDADLYAWTQQWLVCPEGEDVYSLQILQTDGSRLALTAESDCKTVIISPYTGADNQKWQLQRVE